MLGVLKIEGKQDDRVDWMSINEPKGLIRCSYSCNGRTEILEFEDLEPEKTDLMKRLFEERRSEGRAGFLEIICRR